MKIFSLRKFISCKKIVEIDEQTVGERSANMVSEAVLSPSCAGCAALQLGDHGEDWALC